MLANCIRSLKSTTYIKSVAFLAVYKRENDKKFLILDRRHVPVQCGTQSSNAGLFTLGNRPERCEVVRHNLYQFEQQSVAVLFRCLKFNGTSVLSLLCVNRTPIRYSLIRGHKDIDLVHCNNTYMSLVHNFIKWL